MECDSRWLSDSWWMKKNLWPTNSLVYAHQPWKASIPIEVRLVLDGWLRNARQLVVIQLHAVPVACGSNWILRKKSSAVHTVNRCGGRCRCVFTFHCFPSFSICGRFDPRVIVFSCCCVSSLQFLQVWRNRSFLLPISFEVFPLECMYGAWCWGLGSILRLSFSIVRLAAMRFSSLISISFFCVFQSSMWNSGCFHSLSVAVVVLLFMYLIHASFFITAVSNSSSVSFMQETSLSWSQSVFELLPSDVSSSELLWCALSSSPSSSF